ncbi:MAG: hypothetical protein IID42_08210, partial [Planctomycetes bacterium]|nr:hypothetical protein [Planctomycetota bacterium]
MLVRCAFACCGCLALICAAQDANAQVTFEQVETATTLNFINLDIAKPTGTVENDLLIAVISNEKGTIDTPAGWTVIATALDGNRNQSRTTVFYKVAGPSEPSLYTFTSTNNKKASGAILRYSGIDPSSPIDVSAFATGSSINPTAPDVTTTVDSTRVVRLFGARKGPDATDPYPPGTTGRFAIDAAGKAASGAADAAQASAGATGTAAFLLSAADGWVAVTVAIKLGGCSIDADCDDANPCTDDVCNAGTCENTNNDVNSCDDGDVCNGLETCSAGTCVGGSSLNCDDSNVCTTDTCDATLGCQNAAVTDGTACADGDLCNGDETCQLGVCTSGTALNCDDSNVCTTDTCDATLGCQNTAVVDGTACADGDLCNGDETCQAGTCTAGTALNCDDSNVCTTDTCDATLGCQNTAVVDGTACADGDLCNGDETCQAGVCTSGTALNCDDSNVCTTDSCD